MSSLQLQKLRISVKAYESTTLDSACVKIVDAVSASGIKAIGPIPLPTRARTIGPSSPAKIFRAASSAWDRVCNVRRRWTSSSRPKITARFLTVLEDISVSRRVVPSPRMFSMKSRLIRTLQNFDLRKCYVL